MTPEERANQVWDKAKEYASKEIPEETWNDWVRKETEQAIKVAIEEEREACAQIVDNSYEQIEYTKVSMCGGLLLDVAMDIRARSS